MRERRYGCLENNVKWSDKPKPGSEINRGGSNLNAYVLSIRSEVEKFHRVFNEIISSYNLKPV